MICKSTKKIGVSNTVQKTVMGGLAAEVAANGRIMKIIKTAWRDSAWTRRDGLSVWTMAHRSRCTRRSNFSSMGKLGNGFHYGWSLDMDASLK